MVGSFLSAKWTSWCFVRETLCHVTVGFGVAKAMTSQYAREFKQADIDGAGVLGVDELQMAFNMSLDEAEAIVQKFGKNKTLNLNDFIAFKESSQKVPEKIPLPSKPSLGKIPSVQTMSAPNSKTAQRPISQYASASILESPSATESVLDERTVVLHKEFEKLLQQTAAGSKNRVPIPLAEKYFELPPSQRCDVLRRANLSIMLTTLSRDEFVSWVEAAMDLAEELNIPSPKTSGKIPEEYAIQPKQQPPPPQQVPAPSSYPNSRQIPPPTTHSRHVSSTSVNDSRITPINNINNNRNSSITPIRAETLPAMISNSSGNNNNKSSLSRMDSGRSSGSNSARNISNPNQWNKQVRQAAQTSSRTNGTNSNSTTTPAKPNSTISRTYSNSSSKQQAPPRPSNGASQQQQQPNSGRNFSKQKSSGASKPPTFENAIIMTEYREIFDLLDRKRVGTIRGADIENAIGLRVVDPSELLNFQDFVQIMTDANTDLGNPILDNVDTNSQNLDQPIEDSRFELEEEIEDSKFVPEAKSVQVAPVTALKQIDRQGHPLNRTILQRMLEDFLSEVSSGKMRGISQDEFNERARDIFESLDINLDSRISIEELQAGLGLGWRESWTLLKEQDLNRDGSLSLAEFGKLLRDVAAKRSRDQKIPLATEPQPQPQQAPALPSPTPASVEASVSSSNLSRNNRRVSQQSIQKQQPNAHRPRQNKPAASRRAIETISFVVAPTDRPGDKVKVGLPNGAVVTVLIPEGAKAGDVLQVAN
eukprot:c18758_g1_i4.p1 GENE.c18758_g1_i4~~c18758_g1_i4.p1  ORF type:complete len:762 (+),score=166.38 c18758_g1_i4:223-2508(+)